jgi:hypothetical protein
MINPNNCNPKLLTIDILRKHVKGGNYIRKIYPECEELYIQLLDERFSYFLKFAQQTEKICIKAIGECIELFHNIRDKTYNICIFALRQDSFLLKYITEQIEEYCLIAIENRYECLQFVLDQTDVICNIAIEKNPLSIKYIRNPTDQQCMNAVMKDGSVIYYIKNKSRELIKQAIINNYRVLNFLDINNDEDLILEILEITKNINMLRYITNQTDKICRFAISIDNTSFAFIDKMNQQYFIEFPEKIKFYRGTFEKEFYLILYFNGLNINSFNINIQQYLLEFKIGLPKKLLLEFNYGWEKFLSDYLNYFDITPYANGDVLFRDLETNKEVVVKNHEFANYLFCAFCNIKQIITRTSNYANFVCFNCHDVLDSVYLIN